MGVDSESSHANCMLRLSLESVLEQQGSCMRTMAVVIDYGKKHSQGEV